MKKFPSSGPSHRQLKVGETLKHALSDVFMRGDFYGPNGEDISITISEVRISPDLHNATVFFMPLGGKNQDEMSRILKDISPKIRSEISQKVHMRRLPALYFKLDDTFDKAAKMYDIIENDRPID